MHNLCEGNFHIFFCQVQGSAAVLLLEICESVQNGQQRNTETNISGVLADKFPIRFSDLRRRKLTALELYFLLAILLSSTASVNVIELICTLICKT